MSVSFEKIEYGKLTIGTVLTLTIGKSAYTYEVSNSLSPTDAEKQELLDRCLWISQKAAKALKQECLANRIDTWDRFLRFVRKNNHRFLVPQTIFTLGLTTNQNSPLSRFSQNHLFDRNLVFIVKQFLR